MINKKLLYENETLAKKMKHEINFLIGETVFLITDPDQFPRLITGIFLSGDKQVTYSLSLESEVSNHFDFEISRGRTILM